MASEERKAKDQAIAEQNLFKSLGAGEQQAETDAFQCGKCKQVRTYLRLLSVSYCVQRKTIYRQAQTRSADEPMTVGWSFFMYLPHTNRFTDLCNVCIQYDSPRRY